LVFFSVAASICASFTIAGLTTPHLPNVPLPTTLVVYWLIAGTTGIFSAYWLLHWWMSRRHDENIFERIRKRAIGPIGEEGEELRPSDLAALPDQSAKADDGG
jgi:hypothetical protein